MSNKFEIIATIGPKSCDENIIKNLGKAGATSLRLNLSHLNTESLELYKQKFKDSKILPSIDTQGAQIRITKIAQNDATYSDGDTIKISSDRFFDKISHDLAINHSEVFAQLDIGDILKIDFDGVTAIINSIDQKNELLTAEVRSKGRIFLNRAVDVDQKRIVLDALTTFDEYVLKTLEPSSYEDVYISFCNDKNDILKARELVLQNKGMHSPKRFIAKIETIQGIKNLESIIDTADAILVDRGDLSREIKISRIPLITSSIIKTCIDLNTPCFIATNVLDSMISNNLPSRAEISDIYNLLDSGISGIVLAAEVAIGKNPIDCVGIIQYMHSLYNANCRSLIGSIDLDVNSLCSESLQRWL